jgi:hypothetical protein
MPQSRILSVVVGLSILLAAHRGAAVGARSYPTSGVEFTPNRGQLADQYGKPMPEVLFVAQSKGVKCYFTKQGFHYVFARATGLKDTNRYGSRSRVQDSLTLYRVDVAFVGSNADVLLEPSALRTNYSNYYLSNCPNGITHVPSYGTITYKNLYPKIDLVLYTKEGDENELEYDFIVHPGGDANAIQLRYSNTNSLAVKEDGTFRMTSPFGEVTEGRPHSYQYTGENKRSISSRFVLRGNILRFAVNAYNHSRDLVIDPQRLWGTYFGSPTTDNNTSLVDLAVDRSGTVNITGTTTNASNIATTGAFQTTYAGVLDSYIASFGPNGNLRWSTYYGGNNSDYPSGIACDSGRKIAVIGYTYGSDLALSSPGAFQRTNPVQPPAGFASAFIAYFDSTGSRLWGTYFCGSGLRSNFGAVPTTGTGIAFDSANNIIAVGYTAVDAQIATAGAYKTTIGNLPADLYDGFIAKFSPAGARLWSTYVGGDSLDMNPCVSTDAANNIYIAFSTNSNALATSGAFQTAKSPYCLAKFSSAGARLWSTYYLSAATSYIFRMAASRSGNVYLVGYAQEAGLATAGAYQMAPAGNNDGIIAKFNTAGNRVWATYYGGPQEDDLLGIALDTAENIFVGGYTDSPSGIATPNEFQTSLLGPYNPFLAKFDSAGHRKWGTYYGRRGLVGSICLDPQGHVYVGGNTNTGGQEYSTPGAYIRTPLGPANAYITKFCDPIRATITSSVSNSVCPGASITFTAPPGFASYEWRQNDIPIPTSTTRSITFNAPLVSAFYQYTVEPVGAESMREYVGHRSHLCSYATHHSLYRKTICVQRKLCPASTLNNGHRSIPVYLVTSRDTRSSRFRTAHRNSGSNHALWPDRYRCERLRRD